MQIYNVEVLISILYFLSIKKGGSAMRSEFTRAAGSVRTCTQLCSFSWLLPLTNSYIARLTLNRSLCEQMMLILKRLQQPSLLRQREALVCKSTNQIQENVYRSC